MAAERSMADKRKPRKRKAQAIAALCIGGMVVARTMVDRPAADQLRRTCAAMAMQLGGWDKKSKVA